MQKLENNYLIGLIKLEKWRYTMYFAVVLYTSMNFAFVAQYYNLLVKTTSTRQNYWIIRNYSIPTWVQNIFESYKIFDKCSSDTPTISPQPFIVYPNAKIFNKLKGRKTAADRLNFWKQQLRVKHIVTHLNPSKIKRENWFYQTCREWLP